MDEIRAALLGSELARLPIRLKRFRENYDYVATALAYVPGIVIREPVQPGAYLGECLIFRVPGGDAKWFAHALSCEGIDARNLGSPTDANVRAFWNWRFLFPGRTIDSVKALLPSTVRYMEEAVDVPLSSTLSRDDCGDLVTAIGKIAAAVAGRS
jgi:dTDP-4-amino-4,6-dideoxygalactose transaminase